MNFDNFRDIVMRAVEKNIHNICNVTSDPKAPLKMYDVLITNFQDALVNGEIARKQRKESPLGFAYKMQEILDNVGTPDTGNSAEELIALIIKDIDKEFKKALKIEEGGNKYSQQCRKKV